MYWIRNHAATATTRLEARYLATLFITTVPPNCVWYLPPFTTAGRVFLVEQALLRGHLWFALSFNGIRPWLPWSCYAVCFSHSPFARPADHNASPVMAILIPTFHAIQLKVRVSVAVQGGPAYQIASVLFLLPSAQVAIRIMPTLLADPALISRGLLLANAQISALDLVSGWPAR